MNYLLALLIFVPAAFGFFLKDPAWQTWKVVHGKTYEDEGKERVRYVIWQENMKKIKEHNLKNKGFTLAMNQFGDLTQAEFKYKMNGYDGKRVFNKTSKGSTFLRPNNMAELPKEVDWRTKGYVTPVKNQKQCGSCWAFSTDLFDQNNTKDKAEETTQSLDGWGRTKEPLRYSKSFTCKDLQTGSLEGQHFRKTGKLVPLSEQNLVDCSRAEGNYGCEGGLMDNAFRYIEISGGIDTESSYPYTARDGTCHFKKVDVGATDTGYVGVTSGDENALKEASATVGPIAVGIDAGHLSFQFYHSGVYNSPLCSSTRLDHGVLVVGYGTTSEGVDYWLVKNSWGTSWGMEGYIMMSRNKHNQCGIATKASYPLV